MLGAESNVSRTMVVRPKTVSGTVAPRCTPFARSQNVTLKIAKTEIQTLQLEFEGKKIILHNLDLGTPSYRLIYAHDLDSGESVTIEFKGQNDPKKFDGNARVVIIDSNDGPKCHLAFRYSENI
jgi:hypothetical protein